MSYDYNDRYSYQQPPPRRNPQNYKSTPPMNHNIGIRPASSIHDTVRHQTGFTTESNNQHTMMRNFFHGDFGDTVLFKSWILKSEWDTILTCIAFLLLALLVEGLKCYREHLYKRLSFAVERHVPLANTGNGQHIRPPPPPPHDKELQPSGHLLTTGSVNLRMFSWPHVVQSLLHVCQVILSYALMLGVMTMNGWLCTSIVTGAGLGYFLFSWRKVTIVHVAEQCH